MRDHLIFTPDDVDLSRSPLRRGIDEPTFVLGAFNPGLTRLPNGNLLLMVRVAEALRSPISEGAARAIRWTADGYVLDRYPLDTIDMDDPRQFRLKGPSRPVLGLTSLSWLLPVEITPDARQVVAVHYDRAVEPTASFEEYGIEDARISHIGDAWYMTTCAVSPERHSTTLHRSLDGLAWDPMGVVLDHQNKDMCLFEGLVDGSFFALTRPLGEVYFAYPPGSEFVPGPAIHLARSPDALHWKPLDRPGIRGRVGSPVSSRLGGGTPPILTDAGWLMIYHGVEQSGDVGIYRGFWAMLDRDDPATILRLEDREPLMEADPDLTASLSHQLYLPTPVVFPTGIVNAGDHYIVASGEADLACRITYIPKARFA